MGKLSDNEFKKESKIAHDLELVQARLEDMELGTKQFIEGDQAYRRLAKAKQMDTLVNLSHSASSEARININPAM